MMNLYEEIKTKLRDYNKSIENIAKVVVRNKSPEVNQFLEIAKVINYDNSHGRANLAGRFYIMLDNGDLLVRMEYDGSEWFDYVNLTDVKNEEIKEEDIDLLLKDKILKEMEYYDKLYSKRSNKPTEEELINIIKKKL